jgi:predicted transcriptional regulator
MSKRTHREIRTSIFNILSGGKEHSYGELERKVNTNWKTIRTHCRELEFFGVITISKHNRVKITKHGLRLLKKS